MIAMNLGASACLTTLGLAVGVAVVSDDGPVWLAVIMGAIVLMGAWMMYRSVLMRIVFDGDTLQIVGLFRSRRIPRSAILTVERYDLELPLVRWAEPGGAADRWSVLTPVMLGSSGLLPSSMYRRRHRFLATLRRWAPDQSTDSVPPGTWSRLGDLGLRLIIAVWRSPAMRLVLALLTAVSAAYLYWVGWTQLLEVINRGRDLTRGLSGAAMVVALCAEASYWLLPLRRRHPRRWHIMLVVAVTPLAALGVIALFT
jgi:hypothetical protein